MDWSEWTRVSLRGRQTCLYLFHMILSHSRKVARIWSPWIDQVAWHIVNDLMSSDPAGEGDQEDDRREDARKILAGILSPGSPKP